jgi:hypothetical protein
MAITSIQLYTSRLSYNYITGQVSCWVHFFYIIELNIHFASTATASFITTDGTAEAEMTGLSGFAYPGSLSSVCCLFIVRKPVEI